MQRLTFVLLIALASASGQPRMDDGAVWKIVRDGLTATNSTEFWERNVESFAVAGRYCTRRVQGSVVSSEPADRPTRLALAMYGATTPEVTLTLSQPLTKAVTRGTVVRFQGIANGFVRDPFMLTFEVYPDHGPTFIKSE